MRIVKLLISYVSFFLVSGGMLAPAAWAKENQVATFNGEVITYDMIHQGAEQEIFEAEKKIFQMRMGLLKQTLIDKMIRLDPKSKGLSEEEYIDRFIVKNAEVSDAEVIQFLNQSGYDKSKINSQVKSEVKQYLTNQNYMNQLEAWFRKESVKHDIRITMPLPKEPRMSVSIDQAPYRGGIDAKVTIVEFSDFECPYCKMATETLAKLSERYGDKIKIVYKHFPLNIHPNAIKAAEASICAQDQGNDYFWKMHDSIFENIKNISVGALKDKALAIGLKYDQFVECLESGKHLSRVQQDMVDGAQVGVSATPAFLINGRLVRGAQPFEVFVEKIEQELSNNR